MTSSKSGDCTMANRSMNWGIERSSSHESGDCTMANRSMNLGIERSSSHESGDCTMANRSMNWGIERSSNHEILKDRGIMATRGNITLLDAMSREPAEDTEDIMPTVSKQGPVNEGTGCASTDIDDNLEQAFGCSDLEDFTLKKQESFTIQQMRRHSSAMLTGVSNTEVTLSLSRTIHLEAGNNTTLRINPKAKLSKGRHVSSVSPVSTDSSEEDEWPSSKRLSPVSVERVEHVLSPQTSHDSETSSDNIVDLRKHLHIENLHVRSDSSSSCASDFTSSEDEDNLMQKGDHFKYASIRSAHNFSNFLCANPEKLYEFAQDLRSKERWSGICAWKGIKPVPKQGMLCYEEGLHNQFHVKEVFSLSSDSSYGVFLCQDNSSREFFVLKKIPATNDRLVGLEFLTKSRQDFLVKIYGIYKDDTFFWIFQEFIEGVTVMKCKWDFGQVCQFADHLLSACQYLHQYGIAHFDIKLMNVMVRDASRPQSLVMIDFESAKHRDPKYRFDTRGYTVTYLPPWHKQCLNLAHFHCVLETADLWAIACVLIFLLSSGPHRDNQRHGHGIWSREMSDIQRGCPNHCRSPTPCKRCYDHLLSFVEIKGHQILYIHLEQLMEQGSGDPHWHTLRLVLEYLTSLSNVEHKNAGEALRILRGYQQEDYSLH